MYCIYIALFSKALYNVPLIHPFIHTEGLTRWWHGHREPSGFSVMLKEISDGRIEAVNWIVISRIS